MPTGGVVVDGSGRFSLSIFVPGGIDISDTYFISVRSSHTGDAAHASFQITKLTNVKVTPSYGPQGTSLTVTGTGFDQTSGNTVTIDLYNAANAPLSPTVNIGTVDTAGDGTFTKVFNVPAVTDNNYKIHASTASNIANSTSFRIGTIYFQLSSSSGPAGKAITITGNGFTVSSSWNATIGSETLLSTSDAGLISAQGLINKVAYIPSMAPGTYTVTIWDITADIKLTTTFTVNSNTKITLTPSTAPNGFNVSVAGLGFSQALTATGINFVLYNKTSTGSYDRSWPMTVLTHYSGDPVNALVNGTGIVRAYWKVPDSTILSKGTYYVNATDQSSNAYFAQTTFIVGSVLAVATPRKVSFQQGEIITFTIQHSFGGVSGSAADGSYLRIYDTNTSLVFNGDPMTYTKWIKTGDYYSLPYSAQTAGGNEMTLATDAQIGTWKYKWYDNGNDLITSGNFAVVNSTTGPTGPTDITALSKQLTDLKAQVTGITTQITSIQTAATAAQNTATAAQTSADAAKTSAEAATTAANAAVTAANAAKTSADNAAAGTSGLTTLVYAAIGASLVAALAAIVALMQISRKIA
jgi:hypothetical protein